jgi:hypothetical protein
MKNSGIPLLILTTLVLITVTIFASLDLSFSWVFYLTILGQGLLVVAVYKVLTDNYHTDKSFQNWYEDHPKDEAE